MEKEDDGRSQQEDTNVSEERFKLWMDKNNIAYWYIQQDIKTFSVELKKRFTKRPDFFVLIPNFGFILVDVKDKQSAEKYERFFINAKEVEKYINLQRMFNLQCWYVISNKTCHYKTWYWIPINKVIESGFEFKTKENEEGCYSVPIKDFIQVSDDDSLARVFTKVLTLS